MHFDCKSHTKTKKWLWFVVTRKHFSTNIARNARIEGKANIAFGLSRRHDIEQKANIENVTKKFNTWKFCQRQRLL